MKGEELEFCMEFCVDQKYAKEYEEEMYIEWDEWDEEEEYEPYIPTIFDAKAVYGDYEDETE